MKLALITRDSRSTYVELASQPEGQNIGNNAPWLRGQLSHHRSRVRLPNLSPDANPRGGRLLMLWLAATSPISSFLTLFSPVRLPYIV